MSDLQIDTYCLGPWQTNCYVAHRRGDASCWIIDAGFAPQPMIGAIQKMNLQPALLVLTHAHVDHIAGINDIRELWPELPIVIHEAEAEFLTDPILNLSAALDEPVTAPPADRTFVNGDRLDLEGIEFEVRHTPGHSPGGVCLYQHDSAVAFVGDALFAGSIGRYDFPTSDGPTLLHSIREQLLTLPDETTIYPGHGPASTIGRERQFNPYL